MTDKYDIGNRLFANSCSCGAETAPNDIFCPACRIEHEALLERTWPRVVSWDATCMCCQGAHHIQHCPHIWYGLRRTMDPCASCGDPAIGIHCQSCILAGEAGEDVRQRVLEMLAA